MRERDRRLGAASAAASAARARIGSAAAPAPAAPVAVGDRVLDPELGVRGRVLALQGDEAEVQGPAFRLRVPRARLVPDPSARPAPEPGPPPRLDLAPRERAAGPEVDVRGHRAQEARAMVREHIDAASLAGLPRVRVIHGHGTGALRAAVRDELDRHPLVGRVDPAPPNEGGDGATLALLSD